jgi:LmbE family N-acetylglucosaminyl deacetylase
MSTSARAVLVAVVCLYRSGSAGLRGAVGRNTKRTIEAALRRLSLRVVIGRAFAAPAIPVQSSLLVVAPHPDDETLGCGALLARLRTSGNRVKVVIATNGELAPGGRSRELGHRRYSEAVAACNRLGIDRDDLVFLGLEDGNLESRSEVLRDCLASLIADVGADLIFVTAATDRHPDHQVAARVVRDIADKYGISIWEYPIWTWKNWPLMGPSATPWRDALKRTFSFRVVRVPTGRYLDDKRAALSEYRSQLSAPYGGDAAKGLPAELVEFMLRPYELFIVRSPNGSSR